MALMRISVQVLNCNGCILGHCKESRCFYPEKTCRYSTIESKSVDILINFVGFSNVHK